MTRATAHDCAQRKLCYQFTRDPIFSVAVLDVGRPDDSAEFPLKKGSVA